MSTISGHVGPSWHAAAACRGHDPELWFPTVSDNPTLAKQICAGCPVSGECVAEAMQAEAGQARPTRHGIYGGTTPTDRYNAERSTPVVAERRCRQCEAPFQVNRLGSGGSPEAYCSDACRKARRKAREKDYEIRRYQEKKRQAAQRAVA